MSTTRHRNRVGREPDHVAPRRIRREPEDGDRRNGKQEQPDDEIRQEAEHEDGTGGRFFGYEQIASAMTTFIGLGAPGSAPADAVRGFVATTRHARRLGGDARFPSDDW